MELKLIHKIFIFFIDLLHKTLRIKIVGEFPSKPSIIVFWHGNMFPMWYLFRDLDAIAVVSKSSDGEVLSALLKKWNIKQIRGSSNDGGREVIKTVVENAPDNYTLITPDGPRGPIFKLKPGAVVAAHRSQVPLTLCSVVYSSKYTFKKSWDKFILPLPFSKVFIKFSGMIRIPEQATREDIDDMIGLIETKMSNI